MGCRSILLRLFLLTCVPTLVGAQLPPQWTVGVVPFFPDSVAGLSDQAPQWEPGTPKAIAWSQYSCGAVMETCLTYPYATLTRTYYVPDSALAHQVLALSTRLQGFMDRMSKGQMPSPAEIAEMNGLGRTQDSLKRLARRVALSISPNLNRTTPQPGETASGSLQGHTLYTRAYPEGRDQVELTVYVGPAGFSNGPSPDGTAKTMRTEIKCFYVAAVADKRDVSLAQQLLQKVDYAGLAKLIQP